MDELIFRLNSTFLDPQTELLDVRKLIEESLSSTKMDYELQYVYQRVENLNYFIKEKVNFSYEIYSDSILFQNIIVECDKYLKESFEGTLRNRLVKSLNLYTCMICYKNIMNLT